MRDELPKGWVNTNLDQIVLHKKGKKPKETIPNPKDGYVPYILIDEMEGKTIRAFTNDEKVPIANEDDVLIVWDGSIGKTATGMKGAIGSTIAALSPIAIKSVFLNAFLQLSKPKIEQTSRGTGLQHINPTTFWALKFPLPPFNEQKRIAAKLDKIIPKIDNMKDRLERIPQIIKRFRQSVLTAAVTGRLTEKWLDENPRVESAEELLHQIKITKERLYKEKKIRKSRPTYAVDKLDTAFEVSQQWKWCRLEEITIKMSTGPFGSMLHQSDYVTGGIPIINPMNIMGTFIIPSDKMTVSDDTKTRLAKYELMKGNVVLARRGDLSKCGIVSDNEEGWLCGTGSFFLEVGIEPKYFRIFYSSNCCQSILNNDAIGSTMLNLNQKVVSNIPFPLPPLEEQKEIIRQVDKLFAFADKLEKHYQKAKEKINKLPQSVLAKAFRGELTPQNPNDEPAEKLLERIKEEKARLESELKKTRRRITREKK